MSEIKINISDWKGPERSKLEKKKKEELKNPNKNFQKGGKDHLQIKKNQNEIGFLSMSQMQDWWSKYFWTLKERIFKPILVI